MGVTDRLEHRPKLVLAQGLRLLNLDHLSILAKIQAERDTSPELLGSRGRGFGAESSS